MKNKVLDLILEIVSEETEISKEDILGNSKFQEVVDARAIFVYFADKAVRNNRTIARYLSIDSSRISLLLSSLKTRENANIVRFYINKIKSKLISIYEKDLSKSS